MTKREGKFRLMIIVAAVATVISTPAGQALAVDLTLHNLTERIQESYDTIRDFSAEFTQTATMQSVRKAVTESGIVYIKKPKRMYWDYHVPERKRLIINPETAWMYVPEDNMVYIYDADSVFSSKLTLRFLTGVWDMDTDFIISFSPAGRRDAKGNYRLALTPKGDGTGIKALTVTIDRDTYRIVTAEFIDLYDNRTLLTFENITINNDIPDALFTFEPPPDADIYRQAPQ